MVKPKLGTKRTCPKCSTRFYDLGNDDPIVCIDCGHEWRHEPILKAKQPVIARAQKPKAEKPEAEDDSKDVADDEVALETDDDVELGDEGDDVLADVSLDDDDEGIAEVIVDASVVKSDEE